MKLYGFLFVLTACLFCMEHLSAQKTHELEEVVVRADRPLKDIGINKTEFDSLALKENIALSMADVLAFNSSVFIKNYGRATLSTVAFRGTTPSHTKVTWNGMQINNPMMGMTDFSTIPSYFVDNASLLHGTSSVTETGGGLGGLVRLSTNPDLPLGFYAQYIQGIGSFSTFDEFLRFGFSNKKWTVSTRALYMSSPNDYKYVNHDKKENIYDDNNQIIGQYHPEEKNRSGAYKDFQVLQEIYYNNFQGNRFGLNFWFISSNRELPMLTTDYGEERNFENRQREETFRGLFTWNHSNANWNASLKAGYTHTWMAYDYKKEITENNWASMTCSRSRVNTIAGIGEWEYRIGNKWLFNANISVHQHFVRSEDKNIILQNGNKGVVGYDKGRIEMSVSVAAKWQPMERMGLSVVIREDLAGKVWAPLIPAFFIDGQLTVDGKLRAKASISGNYKFPSLNDLYFLPGGNPNLKNEKGFTYDAGISYKFAKSGFLVLDGEVDWFDSYINDWIIWLPTPKGFFSPKNIGKVHSYGIEFKINTELRLFSDWLIDFNCNYSWTPSVNRSKPVSPADKSVGKQLPYIPRHSASLIGRISWKSWSFLYKWCWYSERFTMSSNDLTITGKLPDYFMNNISLEKNFTFKPIDLQFKLAVNNLFNEDYISVLSRPMPGINFEFFISLTPKFW